MKIKILTILFVITAFAFTTLPSSAFIVLGKTWYFHSVSDDYIQFRLSKPESEGKGSFMWISGKEIADKKEGKYNLDKNILTLHFYWAGVKTVTKTYRIEHETKKGFLLIEQNNGTAVSPKAFLFTASQ